MKHPHKSDHFQDVISENMKNILQDMGFSDLDKADKRSRGLAFLRFYLYQIFAPFVDIDDEQIESGIVDKANDIGIDFIHTIDDKVYIIQSKYGKSSVDDQVLEHFVQLPNLIYKEEYVDGAHTELRGILQGLVKRKNLSFHMILITNLRDIKPETIQFYEGRDSELDVMYSIQSFSQLRQEYDRVESLNNMPPEKVVFNLGNEDCIELENINGDYRTVLITQKGTKVQSMYNVFKESLFNYNIRFWLGKNPVNKGMIDTIISEPERFFYYNNGITAVCEEWFLNEDATQLTCIRPQIINGAQTITTMAKQKANLSKVKILFKIIEGERGKKVKSEQGLNENIVKYCNTQTVINASDFRSNDKVQISIENEAKKFQYTVTSPIKEVFYKRKRRKELPKAGSKVITMQDIGKAFYSLKFNPHDLNADIKLLWDTTSKGSYYKVFGINEEKVDIIPPQRVKAMFGIFYLFDYVKGKLKNRTKEECPAVLFKYHVLWGTGLLFSMVYNEEQIQELWNLIVEKGYFVNSKVNEDKEKALDSYVDKVIRAINYIIKKERDSNPTFVIRNFQRDKKFTEALKLYITETISAKELPKLI